MGFASSENAQCFKGKRTYRFASSGNVVEVTRKTKSLAAYPRNFPSSYSTIFNDSLSRQRMTISLRIKD